MTQVYLIRHGATGKREKDQIASDALNSEGKDMVGMLVKRLVGEGLVKIYTSPYARALQTAQLINEALKLPLEQKEELKEITLFKNPLELQNPWQRKEQAKVEKLVEETWQKLDGVMGEVLEQHAGGSVAWVCHGNLIRAILAGVLSWPVSSLGHVQVDLASLSILQWDEKYEYFTLKLFNDTCHL